MNIALWIIQMLLALMFLWHGFLFLLPPAELVEVLNAQFAVGFRLFLGVAEVLAAIGLVLPSLTRILPRLTALAALGLMVVTFSASVFHLSRGEIGTTITTLFLFGLACVVAYMRWKVIPIAPRKHKRLIRHTNV